MRHYRKLAALALMTLPATAFAQTGYDRRQFDRAVDAAILSDISKDRQAERDAKRQPYEPPAHGSIDSAAAARDACAAEALRQAGPAARLIGQPGARTMATGWEVEGELGPTGDASSIPFVCSVRNGSVSGVLLRR